VLFGHDSRTSEVASFAAIPTLDPDHFMKRFASRGAPDVIPLTMMDRYYERRGQNSLIYARFLDENRLLPDETSLLRGEAAPSYSRKVNVMTTTYEHKLGSFVPDFYWFRTYHTVHGDNVAILAMIAAGSPFQAGELVAEVDGVPATIEPLPDDEYTTKTFWFLPPTQRTGAWLRVKRSDLPDPSAKWHVVRLTPRGHGGEAFTTLRTRADFGITFDLDQHGPVPPLEYIERVSGKGAVPYNYFNNGWTDARRFMRIAKEHGVDVTNRKVKVLDWGCGCGRLTRHFLSLPGGEGRIFGSDIDPVNVAWDRDHLSAKAFSVNGLMPPFDFAKNSFDLVFANSVMSHLQRDAAHAWLAELRRILKPGGLALLSYHGEFSLATLLARSQPFVDRVLKSGFDAETRSTDLNDVISDPEYYRQTFMTDASAKALFEQYFDVKEQIVGVVSRYQNLAILKKRS
jgi:SAM-dependent methyltransferase